MEHSHLTLRRWIFWTPAALVALLSMPVLALSWQDGINLTQNGGFLVGVILFCGSVLLNVAPVFLFFLWLVTLCNRQTLRRDFMRWSGVALAVFAIVNIPFLSLFTEAHMQNASINLTYVQALVKTLQREALYGWPFLAAIAAVGGAVLARLSQSADHPS